MGVYIGATGLNEIDDLIASSIEDVSNVLVNRIIIEDMYGSNYTDKIGMYGSNYTDKVGMYGSNYTDKVGMYGSNYTDKIGMYGSNYTDRQINDTSNYVKITSNILDARIKALEGTEGSPGDISLGIPAIPSTGGVAVAAAIATITAACVGANGITAITLIDMLEDKVDLNKTQADKIGGWSSNYSDKVAVWGSNYTDLVGKYTSNYVDKVGVWGSNYTDLVGKYGSNYSDKVGIWGSNYTDLVGIYGSNYSDKVGVWGSNYTDLVGIYGSNYSDKVGIWSSNYTDLQVKYTSNYADLVGIYTSNYADKVGLWSSNYTELVGIYGSNYSDKVGIWSSNYTDLVGKYTSNYADKVGIWGSNYTDLVGKYTSNYADKVGVWSSNYTDLVGIYGSNYSDKVGIWSSNYTERLIAGIGSATNYWTEESTNNIYLNKSGNVGIGKTNPQSTSKLQVQGNMWCENQLVFNNGYKGGGADFACNKISLYGGGNNPTTTSLVNEAFGFGVASGSRLEYFACGIHAFYTGTSGGTNYGTERMRITSTGLNVNGDINISAGSQFKIDGNVLSTFTPSSTNLISVFDTTQFEDATSLIKIKTTWKPTTATTSDTANGLSSGTSISITAITASGLITGNAGLTIPSGQTLTSSGTLTASVINASGLITATQTTAGTNDILNMRYDTRNGIRFQQRYIGTDDVRYDLIQKVANVDKTASLTLYNGNVGIGRTDPTNILQIGSGNRLRIANNNTDFTIIGTGDTPELHTRIFMGGINYTEPFYGGTGNLYYFSGNGGKHLFLTQTTTTETERMRIGNNGNVAIGTTDTSTYKLRVEGSQFVNNQLVFNNGYKGGGADFACNKISLYGGGNNPTTTSLVNEAFGFGVASGGRLEYFASGTHAFYTGTSGGTNYGTQRLSISTDGLNVNGTVGFNDLYNGGGANFACNKLNIWNATNARQYGMGISNLTLDYFSTGNHKWWCNTAIGGANNGFGNERMILYSDGKLYVAGFLGIGGYPTNYQLDIPANGTGSSGTLGLRYFNYDTNITASTTSLNNVSARIGGAIWCGSWIASSSDTRIKEDIEDINDDTALQMILAIQPKTYKYIDKVAKGDKKVYGFIAQQIKEVLPDAVGIEPEYIPNIMLLADYDNDIITLPSQPTKVIIKLNDKIRCYDKDNKHIDIIVIEIIDELTFKIKFNDNEPIKAKEPTSNSSNIDIPDSSKYTDNKIFVSGTEVDDFHTISKEYIFTLNVCATQELHRRIISQEERIKELETKMTDILKYLSL